MLAERSQNGSLYPYDPVKPLPIIFAVILLVLGSIQFYQNMFRYRWRAFCFVMTLASVTWLGGFICRAYSIYHVDNRDVYIAQYVLLFIGPPFYAGAEYFILGRILAYVPYHTPIHPGRVLSTLLFLDVIVETLAANGAATAATAKTTSKRNSGLQRMEAALILQCVLEASFFSFVALIAARCRRAGQFPKHLQVMCSVLFITSAMMLVRCVFRTVEDFEVAKCSTSDETCAYVDRHEWFFWVFEVANITLYVAALVVFPPGRYLPPNDKIYLDPVDGHTEHLGPGYAQADNRPFLLTILDPFDLGSIILGKGRNVDRFWERDNPIFQKSALKVRQEA